MSWDDIKENAESDFIKIKPGEDLRIHLLGGDPAKNVTHFVDNKGAPCGGTSCVHCAAGVKKRTSFKISVYNFATKKEQTMEQGIMVFKQILKIRDIYNGDLSTVDMVISRTGTTATDTKYQVISVPTKFTPDMILEKLAEKMFP